MDDRRNIDITFNETAPALFQQFIITAERSKLRMLTDFAALAQMI